MACEKTDKDLYNDYLKGNQEAFNDIVKRYRIQLLNYINYYIHNIDDSEDIVQEVFLYMFFTKKKYTFECPFSTYLYTIAKSRLINYCKKRKIFLELDESIEDKREKIDEKLIMKEELESVLKALSSLRNDYKTAIYLRDIEGLSYNEICKRINKSLPQVKMLIYRGRKDLRMKINKKTSSKNINIIVIMIVFIAITGSVFAGITLFDIIQKDTTTDFRNNSEYYDYSKDMVYMDGIYYKTIIDYQQYIEDKKKWIGLIDMDEKDFEDYFLIVIAGENYDTTNLYISDISSDDNTIYIDLKKKETVEKYTVISTKIDKSLYGKSIVIRNNPNIPELSDNFVEIDKISNDYNKEDAIKDGCFVIEKEKIISNDSNLFEAFVEKANNGENGYIRIYKHDIIDNITIIDIESRNGIINMAQFNISQPDSQVIYNSGTKIEKNTLGIYWLIDSIGNKKAICSITM